MPIVTFSPEHQMGDASIEINRSGLKVTGSTPSELRAAWSEVKPLVYGLGAVAAIGFLASVFAERRER